MTVPGVYDALQALRAAAETSGLPRATIELVNLRVSQINGCGLCVDLHSRALRALGEKVERIFAVAGWHESPYYSDAERAALALAEAGARIADRAEPVPDAIWNDAKRHYNEAQLGALVVAIATINAWNRLNVVTRQLGGEFLEQYAR